MTLSAFDIDILSSIIKRGTAGITKDELLLDLSKMVKGIAYDDLMRHVRNLVDSGYAELDETGPDDFTIIITQAGKEVSGL